MIDAVVNIVVVLVIVLWYRNHFVVVVVRWIIRAAVVLVLGQVGVRQQGGRQMLKAGVVGVADTATTRWQVSFLGPVGPLGRCQLAR